MPDSGFCLNPDSDVRNIGIVVLCRLQSERLPNKALLPLGKFNVLERCLINCTAHNIYRKCKIVVATTTSPENEALRLICDKMSHYIQCRHYEKVGIDFHAGRENPLFRLIEVADCFKLSDIVRVTGDSPLVSADVMNLLIASHLRSGAEYTFTSNPPLGTRCEVIKVSALKKLATIASTSDYGEYISLYFKNNVGLFSTNCVNMPEQYKFAARLTLDYDSDYKLLSTIFGYFQSDIVSLPEVIRHLQANPSLMTMNADVSQKYNDESIQKHTKILQSKNIKMEAPTSFFAKQINWSPHTFVLDDTAEVLVCNPGSDYSYDEKYLSRFPHLSILATPSTGVTHIDLGYCKSRNIQVLTLLSDRKCMENIHASAEFSWMHVMNAFRRFYDAVNIAKMRGWRDYEGALRGNELHGKCIGIIGMGRVGKKIAGYACEFGMRVYYYDPNVYISSFSKVANVADLVDCDVISVNAYLNDQTKDMINKEFLNRCKPGTIIVNTARGEIVNEDDICDAVEQNGIRYSADVVCHEQDLDKFHKSRLFQLFQAGKVIITPHVAGATVESQEKAMASLVRIINRYLVFGEC